MGTVSKARKAARKEMKRMILEVEAEKFIAQRHRAIGTLIGLLCMAAAIAIVVTWSVLSRLIG